MCIEVDLNGIFESGIFQEKKIMKSNINSVNRKKEKVVQAEKLKNVLNSTFSGILLPFLAIVYSHNREMISVEKFLPCAVRLLKLFYRLNKNSHKTEGAGEEGGGGERGGEEEEEEGGGEDGGGGGGGEEGKEGGGGGGGKREGDDVKEEKKEVMEEDETDCSDDTEAVWSHAVLIAWLEDKFKWVR